MTVTIHVNVAGTGGLCGSSTVTVTVYGLPVAAVDATVPVMCPVVGPIDKPAGRPLAAYVSGSLSASLAEIARSTTSPSALV